VTEKLSRLSDGQAIAAIRSYHQANTLSLEIYSYLLNSYYNLSEDYGPHGNIVGLFFHDLMVHFSGVIIQREFFGNYGESIKFPYVSKSYAKIPFFVDANSYYDGKKTDNSYPLWRAKGALSIAAGDAVPIDARYQRWLRTCFSLLSRYQPFAKAFLPKRQKQFGALTDVVSELANILCIPKLDCLIQNWRKYAAYHTSNKQSIIPEKRLVTGSRASLQNRKLAINFLQQTKPVIGITHGEITNTIFDEPLFGYAELGFCSVLIDYGERRLQGSHYKPLFGPKRTSSRTSAVIKRSYKKCDEVWQQARRQNKLLYVPTQYNGNLHYGPYRGFEDGLYTNWQAKLLAVFPGLTIKAHPKSVPPPFRVRIESRPLEDCFLDYDVFVLDYYSTAATLVLSSDRPVIFFDIGLRNLVPDYLELVRNRCYYVDIDWNNDLNDQIGQAINGLLEAPRNWNNSFLGEFSLTPDRSDKFPQELFGIGE
jgi:hypothetical protein